LDQLRKEGKLPEAGKLATHLNADDNVSPSSTNWNPPGIFNKDPTMKLNDLSIIPQLAFGMYMVPNDESGEQIVTNAIIAGYRHFDCASIYGNEAIVGKAIKKSRIPRDKFYIATKVWKDALRKGRDGVRTSVIDSISKLDCGGYVDICYIHWPVPGYFVDAYRELESIHSEGKIRSIGLSNFSPDEYETLLRSGITVPPVVNQLEVSPVMYRLDLIDKFRSQGIAIVAFKPLNRGIGFESTVIQDIAICHRVSPAQIMLRWCMQNGLIVICKTSNAQRMVENRSIFNFSLEKDEMTTLNSLTTDEDRRHRELHE
jgi:2,5-diketo-D-gluconate reductase A